MKLKGAWKITRSKEMFENSVFFLKSLWKCSHWILVKINIRSNMKIERWLLSIKRLKILSVTYMLQEKVFNIKIQLISELHLFSWIFMISFGIQLCWVSACHIIELLCRFYPALCTVKLSHTLVSMIDCSMYNLMNKLCEISAKFSCLF